MFLLLISVLTCAVRNNNIGSDGARALAEALQTNATLTEMHLG